MHYILDRLHFIILFFGILFSLIFGYSLYQTNLEKEQIKFNAQTKKIVQNISNRMDVYRGVLYSGLGLFEASNNVTREEWKIFVNKLQMKKYFPGIQGLGYSVVIKADELKEHISTVRAQGFDSYDVRPKGKRDIYTSIVYLEPFDKRNQRAFGYDMYSEKIRQKAMRRTIETGLPTLSDKVRLVQEDGHDEQSGFLFYSALYKKNMPLNTTQERYDAIQGFVYSVFRAKDFLLGATDTLEAVDLKMYAGNVKDESTLLFSTDTPEVKLNNNFKKDVNLEIDGRTWLFEITAKDSFIDVSDIKYPYIYILLGLLISFLITIILKRQSEVRSLKDNALFNVSQGVVVTDSDRKIIYTNKGFENLTGYSSEYASGKNCSFVQGEDTNIDTIELIRDNLTKLKPFECEILNYKKDGTPFWNFISITPIFDQKNNLKYFIGIQNDITEKRKISQQLIKSKDIAEKANQFKSDFIANMSHEVRTPMNAILGFIEQLSKNETDIKRLQQFSIIKSSGKTLLNIINDILDLSKIESGKMSFEKHPHLLKPLLDEITMLLDEQIEEKKINFQLNLSSQLPDYINTDSVRLKQVLLNLLGNAIKFTHNGGSILLDVDFDDEKNIIHFAVSDSGIGIAKENQEKIFNSFDQEDGSITRRYGGTGLGLSISYKLVSIMGGDLKVQSEIGKGSKFYFSIPSGESTEKEVGYINEVLTQDEISNMQLSGHILMVEDNKTNQMLLSLILEDSGLTFDIANDGLEALQMYKQNSYDAILMDENMPNMDGMEATGHIRDIEKQNNLDRIPIVAVTASAMSEDRNKFIDAGMDEYISKPYTESDILSMLKKIL